MQETITILLIIVLGFTTHQGFSNPVIHPKYIFSAEAIRFRREWYRLVSPAFLHADWGHYAANALSIYIFGRAIEGEYGPGSLLFYFFLSAAGGSLMCLWLHREEEYRALGASGGALGLVFAAIFLFPGMKIHPFFIPIGLPAWIYAVGYLLYTLNGTKNRSGGVSHEGHFGGMITGMILVAARHWELVRLQLFLFFFVFISSLIALWYFHKNPARVPGFFRMHLKGLFSQQKQKQTAREQQTVDELLDKVSKQGLHSLSNRERKILEAASKNRRAKR